MFRLLRRARRRIRWQRAAQGACAAAVPAMLLLAAAMLAIQLGLLARSGFPPALALAGALVLLGGLVGLAWPVRLLDVAYRLDRANDNADRLGSALEFSRHGPPRSPLMEAAIRDAARSSSRIDITRACPWRLPRAARSLLLACLVVAACALYQAPATPRSVAAPRAAPAMPLLAQADLALQREVAAGLAQEAARLEDPGLAQLAGRFDELLDGLERGEIGREEALGELARLQAALSGPQPAPQQTAQELKQLASAAGELKKEKLTRALGEALERGELEQARQELRRLARMLAEDKLGRGVLEKLAKALGSMARKLAEKLTGKQLEALREEIGALRQELARRGLSGAEEERLAGLEEKLRRASSGQGDGAANRGEEAAAPPLRALNRLHRRLDEAAQKLAEAAQAKGERGGKDPRGQEPRGAQRAPGQEQQQQAARELEQGAAALDRMAQDREQARARQQAEKQLSQLREAIKRTGSSDGQERNQQLGEFEQRAGGQEQTGPQGPDGAPQAGSQAGQRTGEGREQRQPGAGAPGEPAGDRQQGREASQLARQGERGKDGPAGTAAGPSGLGKATEGERAGGKLERLTGKRVQGGEGRAEVIRGAAEKGFSRVAYRQVFVEAASVAEEELDRVQVPAGYRFYVRRYFELIRPRQEQ